MGILGINQFLDNKLVDFNALYRSPFKTKMTDWQKVAVKIDSPLGTTEFIFSEDGAPVLHDFDKDRDYSGTSINLYKMETKSYQSGLRIKRDILRRIRKVSELDVFDSVVAGYGADAAYDITKSMYDKLLDGINQNGWDGVPFFSESHPGYNNTTNSNFVDGAGEMWFLVSSDPQKKPIIYGEEVAPGIDPDADGTKWHSVNTDEHLVPFYAVYGLGYNRPQFAGASKATPSFDSVVELRNKLRLWQDKRGRRRGEPLDTILSPTSLMPLFQQALESMLINGGDTNIAATSYRFQLIEIPELDGL